MKKKKILIIGIIILFIIVVIATIMNKNKKEKQRKTTFENDTAKSVVILEDITFKNITKEFDGGITTIRADVYNNTDTAKSINVKIILKDKNGEELTNMIYSIGKIEANNKKILQTGIMGNYSNVDNIEFKVLSDSEIAQYNK